MKWEERNKQIKGKGRKESLSIEVDNRKKFGRSGGWRAQEKRTVLRNGRQSPEAPDFEKERLRFRFFGPKSQVPEVTLIPSRSTFAPISQLITSTPSPWHSRGVVFIVWVFPPIPVAPFCTVQFSSSLRSLRSHLPVDHHPLGLTDLVTERVLAWIKSPFQPPHPFCKHPPSPIIDLAPRVPPRLSQIFTFNPSWPGNKQSESPLDSLPTSHSPLESHLERIGFPILL